MTYVEGASLHQDRGGVDRLRPLRVQRARELRRRLGDPARLHHPHRRHARSRRRTTWPRSGRRSGTGATEVAAVRSRSSPTSRCATSAASPRRACNRIAALVVADLALQLLIDRARAGRRSSTCDTITDTIDLGGTPTWGDTDLRARRRDRRASPAWSRRPGCRARCAVGRRGLQRLVGARGDRRDRRLHRDRARRAHRAAAWSATRPRSARNFLDAPMLGIAERFRSRLAGRHAEVRRRGRRRRRR